MKLSTKEDIEAPLAFVYAALTDFEGWERAAMRRGAEVTRTDNLASPEVDMAWQVKFTYRGKLRDVAIRVARLEPPHHIEFVSKSGAIEGVLTLDLLELAARRTRVTVTSETVAHSMSAKLLLQSLRLAKAKVTRKFEARVAQFGSEIGDRFRAPPKR
ncbi:SRPBCC family protein [Paracoccaceae bacterium Fryx2]|nr:SRPBCC family protein [Paracoccaceae bacterium Fryx2]